MSTRDCMLTIGFSAGPGLFSWHKHLLENGPIDEKIISATETIHEIMEDRIGIICSSVLGPFPGDAEDLEAEVNSKYRAENETIEWKHWSEF